MEELGVAEVTSKRAMTPRQERMVISLPRSAVKLLAVAGVLLAAVLFAAGYVLGKAAGPDPEAGPDLAEAEAIAPPQAAREAANRGPTKPEAGKAAQGKAEAGEGEPSNAEPSGAEPSGAEPSNAEPSNAEPSNAEPSNAEPSNAEPSNGEPVKAEAAPVERSPAESANAAVAAPSPSRAARSAKRGADDSGTAPAAGLRRRPPEVIIGNLDSDGFGIQLGAYPSLLEAQHYVRDHARALAGQKIHIIPTPIPGRGIWHRVRVGRFGSKSEAEIARRRLPLSVRESAIVVSYR
jgi:cell division protein FtsN